MIELIIVLLIGSFLIYVAYKTSTQTCPIPPIVYRYIPQTFRDSQIAPDTTLTTFADIFNKPDTWAQRHGVNGSPVNSKTPLPSLANPNIPK